jgi:hypothetical protein
MPGILSTPRPVPRGHVPALVGTLVVVLALPIFLVAHWRTGAWVLAAVLWVAGQAVALVLQRLPLGMGSLASSGAVALGRMFRAVAVVAVLLAVAVSDSSLGLPAAIVYAVAYTIEFGSSMVMYFGGEAAR